MRGSAGPAPSRAEPDLTHQPAAPLAEREVAPLARVGPGRADSGRTPAPSPAATGPGLSVTGTGPAARRPGRGDGTGGSRRAGATPLHRPVQAEPSDRPGRAGDWLLVNNSLKKSGKKRRWLSRQQVLCLHSPPGRQCKLLSFSRQPQCRNMHAFAETCYDSCLGEVLKWSAAPGPC